MTSTQLELTTNYWWSNGFTLTVNIYSVDRQCSGRRGCFLALDIAFKLNCFRWRNTCLATVGLLTICIVHESTMDLREFVYLSFMALNISAQFDKKLMSDNDNRSLRWCWYIILYISVLLVIWGGLPDRVPIICHQICAAPAKSLHTF